MMRKLTLMICALAAMTAVAFGGTATYSDKEMKQTAVQQAPCPEWYRDTEWNVSIWGTYAFTGNNWRDDRYIEADHAWGGGLDVKYFFHRYFGVGIEGWAAEATRQRFEGFSIQPFGEQFIDDSRTIGSAKGTLTFRYPLPCSRFSPYIWVGGGGIFGGGERDVITTGQTGALSIVIPTRHTDSDTKAVGQVGAGMEVRVTPHIGIMSDFSWNVVDGSNNNFGMARSGITFAF